MMEFLGGFGLIFEFGYFKGRYLYCTRYEREVRI